METVRVWLENIIIGMGFRGGIVPVLRHLLLILFAALVAWLSYALCRWLFTPLVNRLTSHSKSKWDDVLFGQPVLKSLCGIVPAIVVWKLLPMVFYQYSLVQELVARVTAIYITVSVIRLCFVFINQLKILDTGRRTSIQQYVLSFLGVLRVASVFVGAIVIIAIAIGQNPLKLFAGLGATSAILMLVFKDTIEGLVAGIRLTSANMLHVGDWITVPGTEVNGVVTEMNLTTVKVRNFDNTIFTISPKTLVSGTFQNWKGMQGSGGRRVKRIIYFDFRSIRKVELTTKDGETTITTNMAQFRQAAEDNLAGDPRVNTELMYMVRQMEPTQCGLPVEVYFFLRVKEWKKYEHQLADIMEQLFLLAADKGLKIYEQYPEQ
ncbi:MAG: mechanosensitive ion channel [Prevotella sp.]|nr:mechanosensitive ion channel [Prevotella sp.]